MDRFGDTKRVNSSNLNATILKLSEKLIIHFRMFFLIFGNMFPQSHGRFRCYTSYKLYQRYMFQFIPI